MRDINYCLSIELRSSIYSIVQDEDKNKSTNFRKHILYKQAASVDLIGFSVQLRVLSVTALRRGEQFRNVLYDARLMASCITRSILNVSSLDFRQIYLQGQGHQFILIRLIIF